MNVKESILNLLRQLPDNVTYDEALREVELLAIRAELEAAQEEIRLGGGIPHAQIVEESAEWISASPGLRAPAKH